MSTIAPLQRASLDHATIALARAFSTDPLFSWVFPDAAVTVSQLASAAGSEVPCTPDAARAHAVRVGAVARPALSSAGRVVSSPSSAEKKRERDDPEVGFRLPSARRKENELHVLAKLVLRLRNGRHI